MQKSVFAIALACAACSTGSGRIDGRYSGPGGAVLKLAGDKYQFCDRFCTSGRMEVRPSGRRSGRVTFYGVPVGTFFRNAQQGSAKELRTWADGVETGYEFGLLGGAYIDIDADRHIYFKRRGLPPEPKPSTRNTAFRTDPVASRSAAL